MKSTQTIYNKWKSMEKLRADMIERNRIQTDRIQTDRIQTVRIQTDRIQTVRIQTDMIQTDRTQAHRQDPDRQHLARHGPDILFLHVLFRYFGLLIFCEVFHLETIYMRLICLIAHRDFFNV